MGEVTAFVLAGGKSSRMGADKALLEVNGRTLLERALELAGSVTGEIRIVGERGRFNAFAPVVEDEFSGRGPLGGIHAALRSSSTDFNLVLAVDLPFLEKKFLEYLVKEARAADAVVTLPRAGGGLQPLCGIYRKEFAALAEQALAQGKNKIDTVFSQAAIRIIDEDELARFAFSPKMFENVNTQQDWERARQRLNKP